jgi:hypothetical protein
MWTVAKPFRWLWKAIAAGSNAQFLLVTLGFGTIVVAVVGGVVWAFSSFPLAFRIAILIGAAAVFLGLLSEFAPRLQVFFGGISLTLRCVVLSAQRERMEESGVSGMSLPVKRDACFASVTIYNAREAGGERAMARGITPHVEIFNHDGTRVVEYVGWDVAAERDFLPNGQQHWLHVVGKWKDEEDCFFVEGNPPDKNSVGSRRLGQGTYDVRITLRGKNLRRPIERLYLLSNRGVGHCPRLEATGS